MPLYRSTSLSRHVVRPRAPRQAFYSWFWLAPLAGLVLLLGPSQALPPTTPGPVVIRQGGVYTGTFRSTDSSVPCVTIDTTEPVTLQSCVLQGAGTLIQADQGWAQLTVVNCRGYGLRPSRDQVARGLFLRAGSAKSLRIENNYMEHTTGISIHRWNGDGSAAQTLTVRYNQAKNIDARYRNGGGTFA
ncbi:hypothetical protein LGH70_15145, partial [Hymenobacter sp. BT635]|nr:hypothetical protein [Hymenobacter nitidus]